jgi:hypothetical protein
MDLLGLAGFVFAATALSVLIWEHQADVLHGPYIEGRVDELNWAAEIMAPVRALVDPTIDGIKYRAVSAIYLASLA